MVGAVFADSGMASVQLGETIGFPNVVRRLRDVGVAILVSALHRTLSLLSRWGSALAYRGNLGRSRIAAFLAVEGTA